MASSYSMCQAVDVVLSYREAMFLPIFVGSFRKDKLDVCLKSLVPEVYILLFVWF